MPTRITKPGTEDWTEQPRQMSARAQRLAEKCRAEDEEILPTHSQDESGHETIQNPAATAKNTQRKNRSESSGEKMVTTTYRLSAVCLQAMELCISQTDTTRRIIVRDAIRQHLDDNVMRQADALMELKESYESGAPMEALEKIRSRVGVIDKGKRQPAKDRGTLVSATIVIPRQEHNALGIAAKAKGLTSSMMLEECLYSYLKSYWKRAAEWVNLMG